MDNFENCGRNLESSLMPCSLRRIGFFFCNHGSWGVLHHSFYGLDMPKSKRSAQKRFILKVPLNQGCMQCDCCARPKPKRVMKVAILERIEPQLRVTWNSFSGFLGDLFQHIFWSESGIPWRDTSRKMSLLYQRWQLRYRESSDFNIPVSSLSVINIENWFFLYFVYDYVSNPIWKSVTEWQPG